MPVDLAHRKIKMNHVFRIIWSKAMGTWVVASESSTGRRKGRAIKPLGQARSAALGVTLLATLSWSSQAGAQVWRGTTNTDWSVGSNWSTGVAPAPNATATINTNSPSPTVLGVNGAGSVTIGNLQMGTAAGTTTLTIQNGSTLAATAAASNNTIGNAAGANATLTLTGAGSSWSTAGITNVGNSGAGTLNIANGGAVNTTNALGLAFGGTGGSGTLNVTSGGTLSTSSALVRNGTATVSGVGSLWNAGASLAIGSVTALNGALTVQNGGAVSAAGNVSIGAQTISNRTAVGTATVTGVGSQLTSSAAFNVGLAGQGSLTVSNGALAAATTVNMATGVTGNATLNVSGGGTLATQALTAGAGAAQANFDGATLRATASNSAFISGFSGTALNIAAGGLTLDTAAFNVTANSPFSGTGALNKAGSGTAVLTGNNSYAGVTTISMGTLQLGNGGSTGSILGDVTNNGTLAFDRSDTNVYGGQISGIGAVNQIGTGTTVLSGSNVYTGGTSITAGTLQVARDTNLGAASGRVSINGGTLSNTAAFTSARAVTLGANGGTFNTQADLTLSGPLGGTGALAKTGPGTLTLTATNAYAGGTSLNGGTVSISSDVNLGNASGALSFNGGTLQNTASISSARSVTLNAAGGILRTTADMTLNGVIGGTGGLTKTDGGTLKLTANNTYAGGTEVSAGTLQIGNGGTSGSLASNVVVNSGATLAFNRSDAYTFGNAITGAGGVAQNGTGTTVFNTAQTYAGPTTVNLGTLSVDGSITSPVTVNAAGTLSGTGTVFGNVTNSGTVTPGGGSGVLTIAGNYIGNGGAVRVNTALGGDASATGRLVVTGDTSGASQVRVVNVGGAGALTSEGIKVIDVQGASNGTFTLAGDYTFQGQPAVVAGAYGYRLFKNGVSTPDDGGWYLRSSLLDPAVVGAPAAAAAGPLLAPTVPLYEAYSSVLQRFNELGTLQQRVGNRSWSSNASVQAEQEAGKPIIGRGAWARVEGSNTHIDPSTSTTSASYNVRMWKFEGGVDAPVIQNQSGTLVVGPTFHYGIANASVSSMFGNGSIDATGYGFGGTATWYGNNGSYVDARATLTWYDTDLRSSTLATKLANGNRGSGVATSVEAGHQLALGGNWSITPQAQLAWSQVRFDAFTDQYGANVSRDNGNSLVSRMGVSLDHETKWTAANGKTSRSHVYGITNLYYDFLHGTSARVADISVVSKEQALWAGLGIGASMNWNDDRYTVYGELLARTSVQNFGDSNAIGAKLGARYRW